MGVASINTFTPNPTYFQGLNTLSTNPSNASFVGATPVLQNVTFSPLATPGYASGVTGMQSHTANEMTGGLDTTLETTGDLAGVTGDGLKAAQTGATRAASAAADAGVEAAQGGARAAGSAADAASGLRGAGRLLGPAAIGLDVVGGGLKIRDAWNDKSLTDSQRDQKVGEATVGTAGSIAGGAGGAWAGAAAGAAIGSAVPVVGTVIGGIAGAVLGGFLGGKAGEKAGEAVGNSGAGKGIGGFINNLFGK